MANVKTAVIKLQDIKAAEYNPRAELAACDQQYQALSGSIQENGLVLPLIVNRRDNTLISGHQRLKVLLAAAFLRACFHITTGGISASFPGRRWRLGGGIMAAQWWILAQAS